VKGALYPAVRPRDISSFEIPAFDISDQRRIVAEIEKQFTRLEAGVAALKRVQANLKRYRAAVLKAACEGRLVETEAELARKEDRPYETGAALLTRILSERRKNWQGRGKYKEPVTPEADGLGKLPEGWAWATFEQISTRVTVGFVGSMKHEYVERGVPFLRGQNVRENRFEMEGLLYVSEEFHKKLSKSALQPGDLAVVRSGAVGVTCVIPDSIPYANCSDLVLVQQPLGFVSKYGAYYMNSLAKRQVAAGKVGVALIHFNTKSVAELSLPLPPLAEQSRIVAEVERRLSVIEGMDAAVDANLKRAARLRQAILQKAFSGALV
jgi:type I restriction enzyme S subunit